MFSWFMCSEWAFVIKDTYNSRANTRHVPNKIGRKKLIYNRFSPIPVGLVRTVKKYGHKKNTANNEEYLRNPRLFYSTSFTDVLATEANS